VTITAIGTARTTQIKPKSQAPNSIDMKTTSALTHKTLFITTGTTMLFSVHWTIKNMTNTENHPTTPCDNVATNTAGIPHKIGHKYGIISVTPAMIASNHFCSILTPNNSKTYNQTKTSNQTYNIKKS